MKRLQIILDMEEILAGILEGCRRPLHIPKYVWMNFIRDCQKTLEYYDNGTVKDVEERDLAPLLTIKDKYEYFHDLVTLDGTALYVKSMKRLGPRNSQHEQKRISGRRRRAKKKIMMSEITELMVFLDYVPIGRYTDSIDLHPITPDGVKMLEKRAYVVHPYSRSKYLQCLRYWYKERRNTQARG